MLMASPAEQCEKVFHFLKFHFVVKILLSLQRLGAIWEMYTLFLVYLTWTSKMRIKDLLS